MAEIFNISQSKPSMAISIFCGVAKTNDNLIDQIGGLNYILPWQTHIFADNSPNLSYDESTWDKSINTVKELSEFYYPSFINCLIPSEENTDPYVKQIKSYTIPLKKLFIIKQKSITIDYLDLFFFPENHLVYCFKCDLTHFSLNEIVEINNELRELKINKLDFLADILQRICIPESYIMGNKLKLFMVLEHTIKFDESYGADNILYELGTCSPIGTSIGIGPASRLMPSQPFFQQTILQNKISVFENWSALCLFDTFTLLHRGEVYRFNWEFRYFRFLYIHSIFIKSYLGEINKEFYLNTKNRNLANVFFDFNKHFNLKQISYNFLPQLIYEKIRHGLNVELELNDISTLIEQDYFKKQEKRQIQESENEKRTNRALFIVAILTVFSAVWDGSELFEAALKIERGIFFSSFSLLALVLVYLGIYYFLKKKKQI